MSNIYGFMRDNCFESMRTGMHSVSVFLEYVYGFMRIIVLSVCITCGSSYVSFPRSQYHMLTLRFY